MLKFFQKRTPEQINVEKNDIFYREKYNEIINYIKTLLSDSREAEYHKYFHPKGTLLIRAHRATDIDLYIRLISKNYYVDLYELNLIEIRNNHEEFMNVFDENLEEFVKNEKERNENEDPKQKDEEANKKSIILIDDLLLNNLLHHDGSLLESFSMFYSQKLNDFSFVEQNVIIIWIMGNHEKSNDYNLMLNKTFDLVINIPQLTENERESVLREYCEQNPKISFDIGTLVNNYTKDWEVVDLKNLVRKGVFTHFLNSDLNDMSNEITDILINMIESKEYVPKLKDQAETAIQDQDTGTQQAHQGNVMASPEAPESSDEFIKKHKEEILQQRPSDFMLSQLYENAASKNYNELVLIIDKMSKNEALGENDRSILSKYPFILNEAPNKAQIQLEKAKKTIDLMRQAFDKSKQSTKVSKRKNTSVPEKDNEKDKKQPEKEKE